MNDDKKSPSIDVACKEIEGLDIYDDANGTAALFRVAIEYSRQELKQRGIDLCSVTSEQEIQDYCRRWIKTLPQTVNDMALIALIHTIEYNINEIVKDRKRANNP
jgi:hypothetical protein